LTITDRTPSFKLDQPEPNWPDQQFECAFGVKGATPDWKPCGSQGNLPPFAVTTPLADGKYTLSTRTRSGVIYSEPSLMSFTVGSWSAVYTATTTTQQAGAHPALDVDITPTGAGQLHAVDMTLPKGLIGSLNSFPKCPEANVPTGSCPAATKVGAVDVKYTVHGGINLQRTPGDVYFTGPQVPGDTAGLVINVFGPVGYSDVIIPLRIQLLNNSQNMRVFSDSIPTDVGKGVDYPGEFIKYWLIDFKMHINGSTGSPFPLLTNPSSCAASQFTGSFGDTEGTKTTPATIPYQATGCSTLGLDPTFGQAFSNLAASPSGSETLSGVIASLGLPADNSSIRRITVREPSVFLPNFQGLAGGADQCKPNAITDTDPTAAVVLSFTYSAVLCPASARVGTIKITSPLLTRPLDGEVYLVAAGSLPRFGVKVDQDGISLRLAGSNTLDHSTCDEVIYDAGCPDQIVIDFDNVPDLPLSGFVLNLNEVSRTNTAGNAQLSSKLLTIAPAQDSYNCLPTTSAQTTITSWSGVTRVLQQAVNVTGCDPR
jgi:hypothetical protein